jgi:hypothetical protein
MEVWFMLELFNRNNLLLVLQFRHWESRERLHHNHKLVAPLFSSNMCLLEVAVVLLEVSFANQPDMVCKRVFTVVQGDVIAALDRDSSIGAETVVTRTVIIVLGIVE